tara:strand:+ start:137075 stop:138820 length:1746 start_codon:yes stop_codon:yes gene_type:complete
MSTNLKSLNDWVNDIHHLTGAQNIHWCDGSKNEYDSLVNDMLKNGDLLRLNEETFPECFLHRSDPEDVARVEHLTYVCTSNKEDAGLNNNWIKPKEAKEKMINLFSGCMKSRTLYVIPYCMGPLNSNLSRHGVEITDSPYVVINMYLMTRMGKEALSEIERKGSFVKGLHSIGELDPNNRFIMHFPEELTIMSYGSGYGGNALLGKKCHALRIASYQARTEGWLAEHMLIVGLENPEGEVHYLACAFPSACGKTNLAMLIPPDSYKGWKVWTLGDDIAWLHLDEDGSLRAINPEAGLFGVVPGTNQKTNKNAFETIKSNTIFTNVGISDENEPWWEDKLEGTPVLDWKGNKYNKNLGPAAHPNSRFTVSASNNPSYSKLSEAPEGVPISAIIFGGRRKELAPLVYQAKSWEHGVLIGSSVASETTAAATGDIGIVRRDPMAMKPFCGYNFADYWSHWLSFAKKSSNLPKIFHVNWFRKDKDNKFLWPGFSENMRVLNWIIDRCDNKIGAEDKHIGYLPLKEDINTEGLNISESDIEELLKVDKAKWKNELEDIEKYFISFGERLPEELKIQFNKIKNAINA